MIKQLLALFVAMLLISTSHAAMIEVHEFDTEEQRLRYSKFLEELRCPKCKNNNLAGTNSQIAVDLRRELYRLVSEGQTDEQIVEFMVSRYGDFVLYRPPVQSNTIALWGAPIVFMLIGGFTIGAIVMRRSKAVATTSTDLNPEEQDRLKKMLADKDRL